MSAGQPTLAELIGQKLVVRMEGTTPSADLLGRIRRGEIGGVVLFGSNLTSRDALTSLTALPALTCLTATALSTATISAAVSTGRPVD